MVGSSRKHTEMCAFFFCFLLEWFGWLFQITHLSETGVSLHGIAWLNAFVGIGMIKPNTPLFRDSSCVPVNAEDDLIGSG